MFITAVGVLFLFLSELSQLSSKGRARPDPIYHESFETIPSNCTEAHVPTATTCLLQGVLCTRLSSKGSFIHGFSTSIGPTAMPCWWAPIRVKQLSMTATARVIWLCGCVRYWPYRGVGTCASVHLLGIVITLLPALTVSSVDDAISEESTGPFPYLHLWLSERLRKLSMFTSHGYIRSHFSLNLSGSPICFWPSL